MTTLRLAWLLLVLTPSSGCVTQQAGAPDSGGGSSGGGATAAVGGAAGSDGAVAGAAGSDGAVAGAAGSDAAVGGAAGSDGAVAGAAGSDAAVAGAGAGSGGHETIGGRGGDAPCADIVGQYELTARVEDDEAEVTYNTQVLMSIQDTASGCVAMLAGAWQEPVPYALQWGEGSLVLTPDDDAASEVACEEVHDDQSPWDPVWTESCWTSVQLDLEEDGLGTYPTVVVTIDGFDIDYGFTVGPVTTTATLAPDGSPPEVVVLSVLDEESGTYRHPTAHEPGAVPVLFPWTELRVAASEPVAGFTTAFDFASAEPEHDGWHAVAGGSFGSATAVRFADWDEVRGRDFELLTNQPIADAAGNEAKTTALTFSVLDVGPAAGRHEFDEAPAVVGGDWITTGDAECEQDGCMETEMLAVQVTVDGESAIAMRLRLAPYYPGEESVLADVYLVDLAGTQVEHSVDVERDLGWFEVSFPVWGDGIYGFIVSMPRSYIEDYQSGDALIDYVEVR